MMVSKQTMPPAVILAGGEGKRLRPLTATTPKPLLPMLGEPLLFHILRRLENMGVETAYLMCGYLGEKIESVLAQYTGKLKPVCFREEKPMGSAGCLSLIPGLPSQGECIVVSGDAYFEFDLRDAVDLCRKKDAAAVMCLARVDAPTAFGIVECKNDGRVTGFTEKPTWSKVQGDLVNTGIYVLGAKALSLITRSILPLDFGADIFPALLRSGAPLYSTVGQGYWCDVGTPEAYRLCNLRLSGGQSILGRGTKLAATASLVESVLFDGVQIGAGAKVKNSVIGENTTVGDGATVEKGAVVGASCVIGDHGYLGSGVLLPAGTIVAAHSILKADFNMETQGYFSDGYLVLHPDDHTRCGSRVGRALSACAGTGECIALMQGERKGQSDFIKGLCEGILAGGVDLADCGQGFAAAAAFAAHSGNYAYTLFSTETYNEIRIRIYDRDGLYPDARFERKFSDYTRELPRESGRNGSLFTVRDLRDRYRTALCLAGGSRDLRGMTVKVYETGSAVSDMLEKALKQQGATVSDHADLCIIPNEEGERIEAVVCGMHVGWWQIIAILALEWVKVNGSVLLPYCCPERIKQAVLSAGGRIVYYTLYPENDTEKHQREELMRQQPWIADGLFAAMMVACMIGTGTLRAGELAAICHAVTVSEVPLELEDPANKMRMIIAHSRDFDGEGLLRRYREGNVRVIPGQGNRMHLMAEAAEGTDAMDLIRKVKKEILNKDV